MSLHAPNRSKCLERKCSSRMHNWRQASQCWRIGFPIALYQLYLHQWRSKFTYLMSLRPHLFIINISATMCIFENNWLRSIGSRMAPRCDSERRCVQCSMWISLAKHSIQRYISRPSPATTKSSSLKASRIQLQYPRIQIPRPDTVYWINNDYHTTRETTYLPN